MSLYKNKPKAFFEIIVHEVKNTPGLTGACAGYENNVFRNHDMAEYIIEWLPDFALKYSELEEFHSGNSRRMLRRAAKTVYASDKYSARGEFGELLLHALIREVFNSEPAISKIYYKSAVNETVKGFDAVHVVEANGGLELWLGEVKFYNKDGKRAIADVVKEIKDHTEINYLKNEFILIGNKIDPKWTHAKALQELISGSKSLDDVFKQVCIPVLLTYESTSIATHTKSTDEFKRLLTDELVTLHKAFSGKDLPEVRIHLFIVPLHKKTDLIKLFDAKLKGMQA
jgi:hypothetical protein